MILQSFYLFCSEVCVPLRIHPITVFQKFRENEEISLAQLSFKYTHFSADFEYLHTQRLDKSYNYLPTYQKCFYGTIFLLFCVIAKILLIISRRQAKKTAYPYLQALVQRFSLNLADFVVCFQDPILRDCLHGIQHRQ